MGHPRRHRRPGHPRAAAGQLLAHWLLEHRRRAEQALIAVVATAYLLGVSTRRVEKLAESLDDTQLPNSARPSSTASSSTAPSPRPAPAPSALPPPGREPGHRSADCLIWATSTETLTSSMNRPSGGSDCGMPNADGSTADGSSLTDEIVREGARRIPAAALEAEVNAYRDPCRRPRRSRRG